MVARYATYSPTAAVVIADYFQAVYNAIDTILLVSQDIKFTFI